jgi:hypothetical protein
MNDKNRVMNDYCLMDVMSCLKINNLFRLMKTSHEFIECIHSELRIRKHLKIGDFKVWTTVSTIYQTFQTNSYELCVWL